MTRIDLIKYIWNLIKKRNMNRHGWPTPPEKWLDGNSDSFAERIYSLAENNIKEDEERSKLAVPWDIIRDEVARRDIEMQDCESMITKRIIHREGYKHRLRIVPSSLRYD